MILDFMPMKKNTAMKSMPATSLHGTTQKETVPSIGISRVPSS